MTRGYNHQFSRSAQEQGAFTLGIINFTFQPLDNISPNALAIHEATRVEIEQGIKAGKYSEGLTEQYRIQLERFERKSPGCEIIGFPGLLSYPSTSFTALLFSFQVS